MSSKQKNLVYQLWQKVPKLLYAFWTCKPVVMMLRELDDKLLAVVTCWASTFFGSGLTGSTFWVTIFVVSIFLGSGCLG